MGRTPYELVFDQPRHHNLFPRNSATEVNEEDIDDILEEGEQQAHPNSQAR